MPYTLGSITLPQPKRFTRNTVETAVEHLLMFGLTTKKVQNRKEVFVLEYQNLTQAQFNSILSQYELDMVLTFTVDEDNLSIGPTDVLMDVAGLDFPRTDNTYRQNMVITLKEVA